MALPITACHFVVQWDEDEKEWVGMVQIPPREECLISKSGTPEHAFAEILLLARYALILQDGSAGLLDGRGLVVACELLQTDSLATENFLAQQEAPYDTVKCMHGIIEMMLPHQKRAGWNILPSYRSDGPTYVITTQHSLR